MLPLSLLVSIVSHNQGDLVHALLTDLQRFCPHQNMEVVVTLNVKEKLSFQEKDFDYPLRIHENKCPRGFGANHNAAFTTSRSDNFGVLNPDLRLIQDPFPLLSAQMANENTGVVAPLIFNRDNTIADSARRLPTPFQLAKRYMNRQKGSMADYWIKNHLLFPDWVAGIFMLFPSRVFAEMKGFDERYFLYFEDVDLCSRLRMAGYKILLDPRVSVVHNARRDSHANWQYFKWHFFSGMRFFSSPIFLGCWLRYLGQKDTHTL
jgi:N-acetylglucosaminyl-diphospho-decaprenol L-rhamnosyltransferase